MNLLHRIATFFNRPVFAWMFLILLVSFLFWRQEQEQKERVAFDARRAYDICIENNERTTLVNNRFNNLDQLLVSFGDPNDPRAKEFLAKERAAVIPYRDCDALLKTAKRTARSAAALW